MNILKPISNSFLLGDSAVTSPIYKAIDLLGPYAIGIILVCGLIYSIILGVGYSKAATTDERKAAQKKIISFVIGLVVILGLVVLLYAIREPLAQWASQ